MGWGILAFFLMLSVKELYRALRRKGIEAMHRHTKGVCDGAVAAGLHPWSVPGGMMFSGGRGVLSYAPKDLEGNGPDLDGPALIVLGVAGQEEVFGTATLIWSEGPPLPWYYPAGRLIPPRTKGLVECPRWTLLEGAFFSFPWAVLRSIRALGGGSRKWSFWARPIPKLPLRAPF